MREVDEFETNRKLVATLRSISEITYKDSGHALRSVHAKSHGLLDAELVVLTDCRKSWRKGCLQRLVVTRS
jgi:hypothetical protein